MKQKENYIVKQYPGNPKEKDVYISDDGSIDSLCIVEIEVLSWSNTLIFLPKFQKQENNGLYVIGGGK